MNNKLPAKKQIIDLLNGDEIKKQLQNALPKSIKGVLTPDRMIRIALSEFKKTPKLLECDPTSVASSLVKAATVGLEIGDTLGHAYLVPYYNKKARIYVCQLIVGYRGMIALSRRSGEVESVSAHVVRSTDEFEYELGTEGYIKHHPDDDIEPASDGSDIIGAYAVAKLVEGGFQFEYMPRWKLDRARGKSAFPDGIWKDEFEEMCRKTPVRRLFKYLPVSVELDMAIGLDEQADRGAQYTIEGEFEEVKTTAQIADEKLSNGDQEFEEDI